MTNTADAANALLNGGGNTFKFDEIGDTAKGVITSLSTTQATDFKTKELKFYKDGNPIMQIVIGMRLEDGEETQVYVKPDAKRALKEAVDAAQANGLEVGGTLALRFNGEEPPAERGLSPKKLFIAQYKAPVQNVAAGDLI